jgi:putative hydrolase of the HAD superfamily
MRRALILDLFSTLVPGGDAEREVVNREMAQVLGVEPDAFAREFDATSYERFTSAGTLQTLAELQSTGWRIGLVSNITSETQLQWPASPLPPYFETTAFSAEVGAAKPEPEIYLAACNALGVSPTDCVYLGDGCDNELPGAAALGMYAIRTTEHADSDPTWTGPTVASFTELPALIGALA